jgi:acyl-CoA reductase-like NAD-dependent aldehyde dehydrogenase
MAIAAVNPTTGETVETFEPHDDAEVGRRIAEAADTAVTLRDTTFAQRNMRFYAAHAQSFVADEPPAGLHVSRVGRLRLSTFDRGQSELAHGLIGHDREHAQIVQR